MNNVKFKIRRVIAVIICLSLVAITWLSNISAKCEYIAPEENQTMQPIEYGIMPCQPVYYTEFDEKKPKTNESKSFKACVEEAEAVFSTPEPILAKVNMEDAVLLAKAGWGEYRGSNNEEVAAVYWCILNRVDFYGGSIYNTVSAPCQFVGYAPGNPVDDRLLNIAAAVLTEWQIEKMENCTSDMRVIPPEYMWFSANAEGTHNIFRNTFEFMPSTDYITWDNGAKIMFVN